MDLWAPRHNTCFFCLPSASTSNNYWEMNTAFRWGRKNRTRPKKFFLAKPQVCLPIVYPHILCELVGNMTSNRFTLRCFIWLIAFAFSFPISGVGRGMQISGKVKEIVRVIRESSVFFLHMQSSTPAPSPFATSFIIIPSSPKPNKEERHH